ncbi:MAG TPA: general stress protein [Chloroflexota bacterium]|jgi:hypothetical protein|nr:general stress protein [Chloroflexota bacterium]
MRRPMDEPRPGEEPNPRVEAPQYDDRGRGPLGAVPNLEARTVVGVFERREEATAAAQALRDAGYSGEEISVVHQDESVAPVRSAEETKSGSGTVAGASAGALLGGALGLAALTIPGIGPLLAAGPIVAALSGAVAGGAIGGLVGSFAGLGVPTEKAQAYEAAVRSGAAVVAVRTQDEAAAARVVDVLNRHGARQATTYQPAL